MTEVAVPTDFRIAVTIYKLSRGDYIYTLGEMCSLAKATVCTIISETCTVIMNTLWDNTAKRHFPTSVDYIQHIVWENLAKNGNFPTYLQL